MRSVAPTSTCLSVFIPTYDLHPTLCYSKYVADSGAQNLLERPSARRYQLRPLLVRFFPVEYKPRGLRSMLHHRDQIREPQRSLLIRYRPRPGILGCPLPRLALRYALHISRSLNRLGIAQVRDFPCRFLLFAKPKREILPAKLGAREVGARSAMLACAHTRNCTRLLRSSQPSSRSLLHIRSRSMGPQFTTSTIVCRHLAVPGTWNAVLVGESRNGVLQRQEFGPSVYTLVLVEGSASGGEPGKDVRTGWTALHGGEVATWSLKVRKHGLRRARTPRLSCVYLFSIIYSLSIQLYFECTFLSNNISIACLCRPSVRQ